jgi:hypothetical protein
VDRVWAEETAIVRGRTSPLAIWKKEASTSLKQSVLNTSPMMLTDTTGNSFFATARSIVGILILPYIAAEACRRMTAIISWRSRRMRGRSGELFRTALFL